MEYVKLVSGHGQFSKFSSTFPNWVHNFPFACLSWLYNIVY